MNAMTDNVTLATVSTPCDMLIPLNQLVLSENNVRTVRHSDSIAELAAQIHSQGLIHRLSVSRVGDDSYAVEAGGRRLAALQMLAADGCLDAAEMIECRLYDTAQALEISTAENSHEAMHPADQFVAFAKLIDAGLSETEVAHRFGVTPLTVKRRMTLANVAPEFVDMYRRDTITLELLQALTLTDSHERQRSVWQSLPAYNRSAYYVRAAIMQESLPLDHQLVAFVGLAAYTAAGGVVGSDLFEEAQYAESPDLVRELASQRLDAIADSLREQGWSWVDICHEADYQVRSQYTTAFRADTLAPAQDEQSVLDDLDLQAQGLAAAIEAWEEERDGADYDDGSDRADWFNGMAEFIAEFRDELMSCFEDWSEAIQGGAGVLLSIDWQGRPELKYGLVRRCDDNQTSGHSQSVKSKERAEFSEKLMTSLTAHRTAAVQAALLEQPNIALALLVGRLADEVLGERYYSSDSFTKVSIDVTSTDTLERQAVGYTSTTAHSHLISEMATCRALYAEAKNFASTLAWCMQLDQASLQRILTCCISQSINLISPRQMTPDATETTLTEALNFEMANWWQADESNYFNSVSKAQIIEAVAEGCSATVAAPIAGMKKGDAANYAAAQIKGARWLPKPLRKSVTITA